MEQVARRRRRRCGVLGVTATVLALLAVGPVAADTDLGERGNTGPHLLVDTASSPGARCDYSAVNGGLRFAQMEVQPPIVYPAGTRQRQKVSWVVQLQRKRRGIGGWRTKVATDPVVARATATAPAAFTATWLSWSSPAAIDWRAVVEVTWLYRGLETGFSRHRVDHYAIGASLKVQNGKCANLLSATGASAGIGAAPMGSRAAAVAGSGALRRD